MNKTLTPEDILHVLESAEFDRWYQEEFNDFVVGDSRKKGTPSREEILKDIANLFWKSLQVAAKVT